MELLDISGALGMADEQAVSWDNPSIFLFFIIIIVLLNSIYNTDLPLSQ